MVVEVFLYFSLLINFVERFRGEQGLGIIARGKRKRGKKWMWVVKPGDRSLLVEPLLYPQRSYLKMISEHWKRSLTYIAGCLEMYYPTHPGILLRITIGLRMRSIES
jgi:hypothetical protein